MERQPTHLVLTEPFIVIHVGMSTSPLTQVDCCRVSDGLFQSRGGRQLLQPRPEAKENHALDKAEDAC